MHAEQIEYNAEVLRGHRAAVATLRALLTQETDPLERRKLANALLRARPVKVIPPSPCSEGEGACCSGRADEGARPPSPAQRERVVESARPGEGAFLPASDPAQAPDPQLLSIATAFALQRHLNESDDPDEEPEDDLDDLDQLIDPDNEDDQALNREAEAWAHRIMASPDPLAAMRELQKLLASTSASATPATNPLEST